jgi:CRP-like cAMP-binding protein
MLHSKIDPEDWLLLTRQTLFHGLDDEMIEELLASARVQSFPRRTMLFLQGEPADRFFVIFEGWVKLFRELEGGEESVIAVFGRGDSFAEAAIFDRQSFPVSAVVVEDARLLVIPAAPFLRHLAEDGSCALNMIASLSRRLRLLVHQVERLAARSSTERVAEFLYQLCPKNERSATVHLPMDKALIAGRLGMQPETLSRSLAKLRRIGVQSEGGAIVVPDIEALRQLGHVD